MEDEVDFLSVDKQESFLQVDSIAFRCAQPCMSKIPKPTGLQYLKENVKDKVDFLPKNKDERFFQIHTIVVGLCSQACPNYPK